MLLIHLVLWNSKGIHLNLQIRLNNIPETKREDRVKQQKQLMILDCIAVATKEFYLVIAVLELLSNHRPIFNFFWSRLSMLHSLSPIIGAIGRFLLESILYAL